MGPSTATAGDEPSRTGRATAPCVLLLGLVAWLAWAGPAAAQHLSGRLLEVETNRPIEGGVLTLVTPDGRPVAVAMSDEEGHWELAVPGAGRYHLAADGLGYERWVAGPLDVGAGADLDALFHLRPEPLMLEPLEVRIRAVRRYLEYSGFFDRQRGNFGHFMGPEQIDRRQATRLTDLLVDVPGVQLVPFANGSVGPTQIQLRGSSLSRGGVCRPRVFVDGLMFSRGDSRPIRGGEAIDTEDDVRDPLRQDQSLSLDDIGHPSTIAGIEVYRSASQVPVQFGGTSVETLCGVIVIWTRTGRMRGSGGEGAAGS